FRSARRRRSFRKTRFPRSGWTTSPSTGTWLSNARPSPRRRCPGPAERGSAPRQAAVSEDPAEKPALSRPFRRFGVALYSMLLRCSFCAHGTVMIMTRSRPVVVLAGLLASLLLVSPAHAEVTPEQARELRELKSA